MENYIIAGCTDTGRVRKVNEDSTATFSSPNGMVVVVCDGMGGQNAGDIASKLAVDVIQDILTDNTFASPEEAIVKSVMAANQAILHRASTNVGLEGMGATCVMLIIQNNKVYYGSVGDSRIYYVAEGMIRQLTKDQSYVQTLVDAGELTQEAAEHHKDKNQITNALGLEDMTPPVVGQIPIVPEPGSIFVLCSDGLSGMLNNNAILNTVMLSKVPLTDRARMLVQQANDAGGNDNITVQLVEFNTQGGNTSISHPQSAPMRATPSGGGKTTQSGGKKGKLMLGVMLSIIILLSAGGIGWWYLSKPEPQKNNKPAETTKVKRKEQKPTPQTTDTQQKQTTTQKIIVVEEPTVAKPAKKNKTDNKKTIKQDGKAAIKEKSINEVEEKGILQEANDNRKKNTIDSIGGK